MERPLPERGPTARAIHVAWIPTKFAQVGRVLDIDIYDPEGRFVERRKGFVVRSCGAVMTAEQANARSRDYRHQREHSDV